MASDGREQALDKRIAFFTSQKFVYLNLVAEIIAHRLINNIEN